MCGTAVVVVSVIVLLMVYDNDSSPIRLRCAAASVGRCYSPSTMLIVFTHAHDMSALSVTYSAACQSTVSEQSVADVDSVARNREFC